MEFITGPLIVFIVFAGVYGLFELIIRRKERMAIIEKMGDKLDPSMLKGKLDFCLPSGGQFSFGALKIACLLIGLGLGLLVGFFIYMNVKGFYSDWRSVEVVYGSCVMIFGGIGLLVAFLLEMYYNRKHGDRK